MLTLVVMAGGGGVSSVERQVASACRACARDTVERGLETGAFDRVVVATDDATWAATLSDLPVSLDVQAFPPLLAASSKPDEGEDPETSSFHFGRRLAGVVERHAIQRLLYVGGASMPLVDAHMLSAIAARLRATDCGVVTNNIHSSDWAGIAPARAVVEYAGQLPTDNALCWTLWRQAGLEPVVWPRSAATQLDLDTPPDVQVAALHPACGPHLRACARSLGWDDGRLRAARDVLCTEGQQVILAGRVPQSTWSYLESRTMCWLRVFSEERGMRASRRLARGEVRSLLAEYLACVGARKFFDTLADLANAVFLDSRVIMAARGSWPHAPDRLYSDLLRPAQIAGPFWREFTQAALETPIPIVLGGHALVAGGLWALLEG